MLQVKPPPSVEEARAELKSVLESGLFTRSPRLTRLLEYLCDKHLEGGAEEVKEYQIGVEVLGRPSTFDPTEDAAARVEAYRLRKRLKEFYDTEGQSHALRIDVPLGHYTVAFHRVGDAVSDPAIVRENTVTVERQTNGTKSDAPAEVTSEPVAPVRRWPVGYQIAGLALLCASLLAAGFFGFGKHRFSSTAAAVPPKAMNSSPPPAPPVATPVRAVPPASGGQDAIRIVCGRNKSQIDRWGDVWEADRNFEGGTPSQAPRQFIARAFDPKLFQAGRLGNFTYKIPLAPGVYELHLFFVESTFGPAMPAGGGEISRLFDIQLNGKPLLERFDIYSDAGGSNIADERVFKDISPGPGNVLTLSFQSAAGSALVNAIEIVPAAPHHLNPIRIVAQEGFYTDSNGALWKPDRYFRGGETATHAVDLRGTKDPELYARERYGHFDYAIPVDKGTYKLSLFFAEEYFGPVGTTAGQPGKRLFDVTCNGVSLLKEFDLLKEGGPAQAVVKTFHGLTPNGQGKLFVDFSPVHDYASLYAIEVIDESN